MFIIFCLLIMNPKVKIHKVVPMLPGSNQNYRQIHEVNGVRYAQAMTKFQQSFTGYPIHILLLVSLNENDYEYFKLKATVKYTEDQKELEIGNHSQVFKDIRKNACKKYVVFSVTPLYRGSYKVIMQSVYKAKNFLHGGQAPTEQKSLPLQMSFKCEQPFEITQKIISEDKQGSYSFPLFIQYTIQSKMPDREGQFEVSFQSQKFAYEFLNTQKNFKLAKDRIFYCMLELAPKNILEILNERGITLGNLKILYGQNGKYIKKTSLKPTDRYIFFKGQTINKTVPKKDIATLKIRFSKTQSLNFDVGNMKIIINEKELSGIKITKTSKEFINLDKQMSDEVDLSIICLKSGYYHLKGIMLQTADTRTVNYCNDLTFSVEIEQQKKIEKAFDRTTTVQLEDLL